MLVEDRHFTPAGVTVLAKAVIDALSIALACLEQLRADIAGRDDIFIAFSDRLRSFFSLNPA